MPKNNLIMLLIPITFLFLILTKNNLSESHVLKTRNPPLRGRNLDISHLIDPVQQSQFHNLEDGITDDQLRRTKSVFSVPVRPTLPECANGMRRVTEDGPCINEGPTIKNFGDKFLTDSLRKFYSPPPPSSSQSSGHHGRPHRRRKPTTTSAPAPGPPDFVPTYITGELTSTNNDNHDSNQGPPLPNFSGPHDTSFNESSTEKIPSLAISSATEENGTSLMTTPVAVVEEMEITTQQRVETPEIEEPVVAQTTMTPSEIAHETSNNSDVPPELPNKTTEEENANSLSLQTGETELVDQTPKAETETLDIGLKEDETVSVSILNSTEVPISTEATDNIKFMIEGTSSGDVGKDIEDSSTTSYIKPSDNSNTDTTTISSMILETIDLDPNNVNPAAPEKPILSSEIVVPPSPVFESSATSTSSLPLGNNWNPSAAAEANDPNFSRENLYQNDYFSFDYINMNAE